LDILFVKTVKIILYLWNQCKLYWQYLYRLFHHHRKSTCVCIILDWYFLCNKRQLITWKFSTCLAWLYLVEQFVWFGDFYFCLSSWLSVTFVKSNRDIARISNTALALIIPVNRRDLHYRLSFFLCVGSVNWLRFVLHQTSHGDGILLRLKNFSYVCTKFRRNTEPRPKTKAAASSTQFFFA